MRTHNFRSLLPSGVSRVSTSSRACGRLLVFVGHNRFGLQTPVDYFRQLWNDELQQGK
jgi:hypothetical protein